ncbi:MAG: hypothetical protein LBN95_14215 [Prevotellaceae bacterium]|nr:hypothetical protein [Prevotellaceae bacterium]
MRNIFCTVLAVWFLSVAVGYNIVKYCCSGCSQVDITLCENSNDVKNDDCCGGFAHQENDCTNNMQNSDEHCALIYVKADFPVTEHSDNQKIAPKVFDLPIIFSQNDFFFEFSTKKYQTNLITSPPNLCGRDILIQKSVLII